MRKKDEEVVEKVVNKIIDSKVLLTGDGDFCVDSLEDKITHLYFRNLFSPESRIKFIFIDCRMELYFYNPYQYRCVYVVQQKTFRINVNVWISSF